ncbi:transaldolase [Myxococcota bacterium]|nr:transaldolase [Myxococcota bacterium]MCZ7619607.1 transaldolase [Myxococcota bacterium]
MNPTRKLQELGQSLWLDNITRSMLQDGTLQRYIDAFSVTGLTSNPTIFDRAIGGSDAYDAAIRERAGTVRSDEDLFISIALDDLRAAADALRPIHERTGGVDGWVSMEVSPLLAYDTTGSIEAAKQIHEQAERPNLLVKIPGTAEGLPAIEEAIFRGIPINVTLLFSCEQYLATAEAYLRGIERRIEAGLDPRVGSVASLFVSRWDRAVADRVPAELRNRLGIAIGGRTYRAYRELLASPRFEALAKRGARAQRLLWASTGTKDPDASETLYVEALAAPDTVNTVPDNTLEAFAERGTVGRPLPADGGNAEAELARFEKAGVDLDALAAQLQRDGAESFVDSWKALLGRIASKRETLGSR